MFGGKFSLEDVSLTLKGTRFFVNVAEIAKFVRYGRFPAGILAFTDVDEIDIFSW